MKKKLTAQDASALIATLKNRFEQNKSRHFSVKWEDVAAKIESSPDKLWSLNEMEASGGEPDVVELSGTLYFVDCAPESPKGRRSLCFDLEAWESRKEHKPQSDVMSQADEMGIELINEAEYRTLQQVGKFDLKTSSWIVTPSEIRKLGGALFCDRRYNTVFLYHNGAESYYAARGFRGKLRI